jgi:hypothetical protein
MSSLDESKGRAPLLSEFATPHRLHSLQAGIVSELDFEGLDWIGVSRRIRYLNRSEPVKSLGYFRQWSQQARQDIADHGYRGKTPTVEDLLSKYEEIVAHVEARLTADHLLLDAALVSVSALAQDHVKHLEEALRIAENAVYGDLPLSTAVTSFNRLVAEVEAQQLAHILLGRPRTVPPEDITHARALLTELELRLTLTE